MTAARFLELALSVSVQVAILIAATHWLGRYVSGERARCRLWALCYAAIVLAALAGLFLPHPRLFRPWTAADPQTTLAVVSVQGHLGAALLVIWVTGVAASLVHLAIGSFGAARFLRTCRPVARDMLPPLCSDSRWPASRIRLLSSPLLASPFCWQFHRPYIVLPQYVLDFEPTRLDYVLRHEVEHLRCGHPLQLFVQHVVEIAFWFHPLVWWASHQVVLAREFACDDAAIGCTANIADYLRSLLAIVEQGSAACAQSPTPLSFGRSQSVIAARARRLVAIAREGSMTARRLPAFAAALGLAAATALAICVWMPVDVLASPRATWSPWPKWTAGVLHDLGIPVRDFEPYDRRIVLQELLEDANRQGAEKVSGGKGVRNLFPGILQPSFDIASVRKKGS